MTTKLPPGAPQLEWESDDGEESSSGPGEAVADSGWDGVDEPDDTQANLAKIARARRKPASGSDSAKG